MELRQLRYFVKVAQLKSFSEAARALYVSQSTLSQQVRQLEDEIGAPLLVRNSRHVQLSDYGELFLGDAEKVLRDSEDCLQRIRDVRNLDMGTLNIGATFSFCPLLMETAQSFIMEHPGITCNIRGSSIDNLMDSLQRQQLDMVLSYMPEKSFDDIESHALFNTELSLIVSETHVLADRESISLKELCRHPVVLPARGLQARYVIDDMLAKEGLRLNVRSEINDLHMIFSLISSGFLGTILSKATIGEAKGLKAIALEGVHADMQGSYHLRKNAYHKESARLFLRKLVENNSFNLRMEAL